MSSSPSLAPDFQKDWIVRAGAGAGKTYTLTHHVMDYAEEYHRVHGRWPRVVVTTFTRKATQELRERLLRLTSEKPHMVEFVNSSAYLVISTIHGVLDLYLRRYGHVIGLDTQYSILSGTETDKLMRKVLRAMIAGEPQWAPLFEVFGSRIILDLLKDHERFCHEFPEARPEDAESLSELMVNLARSLYKECIEAAAMIRAAEGVTEEWLAIAGHLETLLPQRTDLDWPTVRMEILRTLERFGKKPRMSAKSSESLREADTAFKKIRDRLAEIEGDLYSPEGWALYFNQFNLFEQFARAFQERYQKARQDVAGVTLSDLEFLAWSCLHKAPETAELFSQEWDYWLIDEFQDTSPFQLRILKGLIGATASFSVGDPQQSIYLFRGARSEVFDQRLKEIETSGGLVRRLEKNYRSRPELLMFLNDFFQQMGSKFQPMEPNIAEGQSLNPDQVVAHFRVLPEDAAEDLKRAETLMLVEHIQDLRRQGAGFEDICILARKNKSLYEVARVLEEFGVPYHVHASSTFFSRREILDAKSLLRFFLNPYDDRNFVELCRSPWFRIDDTDLIRIAHEADQLQRKKEKISYWQWALRDEKASRLEAIERLQKYLQISRQIGVSASFRFAVFEDGLLDVSTHFDPSGRREANLWKFLALLQREERKPGFRFLKFLQDVESQVDLDEDGGEADAVACIEPNRVNLMTVHASKGLEFQHVLLPRLHEQQQTTTHLSGRLTCDEQRQRWSFRLPNGSDGLPEALPAEAVWLEVLRNWEREEHLRTFYVACTRAIDSIYFSWSGSPQKDSWAEWITWPLSAGVHQRASYSFQVLEGDVAPETYMNPVQMSDAEIKKWSSPQAGGEALSSVTEMLERRHQMILTDTVPQIQSRVRKASEGVFVHRFLELLKFQDAPDLGPLVARWFPNRVDEVVRAIRYVQNLKVPPVLELIEEGYVEWGFFLNDTDLRFEGQIDLWGATRAGEVWIVDYKTGDPRYLEKAFEQLELYSLAVRRVLEEGSEPTIRLAVLYPFLEKVEVRTAPEAVEVIAKYLRPADSEVRPLV